MSEAKKEEVKKTVYQKLQQARVNLQSIPMNKSGHNKFAGYHYFELSDFLPSIQTIFNDIGLCGVVNFTTETATLSIVDIETGQPIIFTSPMGSANLKGCHDVQNIGAVETYQRRYLYTTALEIVEGDGLSATSTEKPEKQSLDPSMETQWGYAKAAYLRDGNLNAVLAKANMTKKKQAALIEECNAPVS